jgi:hypothetical protein
MRSIQSEYGEGYLAGESLCRHEVFALGLAREPGVDILAEVSPEAR